MLRVLLFGILAIVVLAGVVSLRLATPAQAQASCMHCQFAAAKCKRIGTLSPAKCEEQRLSCVKECKAADAAPGGGDKAKAADKAKKARK